MLNFSFFLGVAVFAFVMSVTPGPNNMMLLSSGAQFGFRRTLPHMLGIILGMASLLLAILLGLGSLFILYPPLYSVLKWVGGAYLLWLAWKIANAPTDKMAEQKPSLVSPSQHSGLQPRSADKQIMPMRWWQASLFQYVNPKAWMMSIGCVSSFSLAGDLYVQSGFWIIILFACMGFPAITIWVLAGEAIRRKLTSVKRQRLFNIVMGVLTASTLLLIIKG
ncbi:Cysteine/O-acetylserine efflux protein [Marinomonas spartinae]|uniref:Cysteine/O-acetylserine efflux protein n=1 Tax=Marinomonas spartinae TaxID=1792290 RepID=A0A1A8TP65_9GAMM|nr:LysE family translocator [Marinomonas spartinae]SBS32870.1 Cysteine/O-acetylserine efflux protein [Marinomonas spartinae]SBS35677.1 Cysteine/O-acetylserine efflux protein [Marinomonas spartinae]